MIGELFKIKKYSKSKVNSFLIGNSLIITIELFDNPRDVIINKLLNKLLQKMEVYWFKNYEEMEDNFEYFIENNHTYFVIIN